MLWPCVKGGGGGSGGCIPSEIEYRSLMLTSFSGTGPVPCRRMRPPLSPERGDMEDDVAGGKPPAMGRLG
ncbi:hypothetical protein DFQ26_002381 [Actinomortierella ambigua]|nr:hypothetical protein DFQ26_002381 [Actinomortierella ambigua]